MKLERLDKVISSQTSYSRKEVKKLVAQKKVLVNNQIVSSSDIKIAIEKDTIIVNGERVKYNESVYLILNKPKGYISATEDKNQQTVLDLVPENYKNRSLFPAGRLDKDTTGLMIITDDGNFAHDILSPKKHVKKEYEVELDIPVTAEMEKEFANGIKLNDGQCKTAILKITGTNTCCVTITEGRYHQIKRMFGCFGAKVINLNRIAIGNLKLPSNLKIGECRELTNEELILIKEKNII